MLTTAASCVAGLMLATAVPTPTPSAVRAAVNKALPVLWAGADGHSEHRTCFTCHNHAVPLLAFATARNHGFDVPEKRLNELIEFITDDLERYSERFAKGQGPGPSPAGGGTDNTAYALFALDVAGHKPDATTAATADYTLKKDRDRGFWPSAGNRPPSEVSAFTVTALALRGVRQYAAAEHRELVEKRTAAARAWLLRTPAKDTEDRVFRLLGLHASGATAAAIRAAATELLDAQRPDGGWGQTDKLPSDAYATGSALFALHTAGGRSSTTAASRRGVAFLLATQKADGSWHVASRSKPFQKYFETGFPHAKDQFISCAATAWATTALAVAGKE